MKLTDLRNAVNDIEFDEEKQERLIREIRAGDMPDLRELRLLLR